jgi:hypothetical protein
VSLSKGHGGHKGARTREEGIFILIVLTVLNLHILMPNHLQRLQYTNSDVRETVLKSTAAACNDCKRMKKLNLT